MAGVATEEFGVGRSFEEAANGHQLCQTGEALVELRSSDHIENGTPSTSPPYWDSDDVDGGSKPSELYGKHTWKIDKFSQVNKRELRSNAFEVGGHKWYILIYPQGCDVCNHLSFFLCVANHDKLLPGWSHLAQFTIAVVNKDPKKSKYSDTLHRFWKKEHDWGWKKFMELSKVMDGFIDADTLVIKAQVQVIRERADRPFRCLDCQYRRELVRVYVTNVETICRRFVEECRGKIVNLIKDKARWSSFRAFWLGMDQTSRCCMSQEKADTILKVIVKHFFIEKEVTSTLVMDSLYSGLRALKGQAKGKKIMGEYLEMEHLLVPFSCIEKEMLALVDDMLPLLERVAVEPLPSKDEKGPQNRTKDAAAGEEFNKDSIQSDERRLTELGRRTIEIFVLVHIFSKIEVAYQEAVSLKRQEELIREEEAAWLADIEQKMKGGALDKEKKSKKKQGKQKRTTRRGKDKLRDDKPESNALEKVGEDYHTAEKEDILNSEPATILETLDAVEDVSDASDSADCVPELLQPNSADREESPVNWETNISGVHPPSEGSSGENSGLSRAQNGVEGCSLSVVDDSSSTSSTESIPSIVTSLPHSGNSRVSNNNKLQKESTRARNHRRKITSDTTHWVNEELSEPFDRVRDRVQLDEASQSSKTFESNYKVPVRSLPDNVHLTGQKVGKEEVNRNLSDKNTIEVDSDQTAYARSPPRSPSISFSSIATSKLESELRVMNHPIVAKKPLSESGKQVDRTTSVSNSDENTTSSQSDNQKFATPKHSENPSGNQVSVESEKAPLQYTRVAPDKSSMPQVPVMSRPLSAYIFPAPRPAAVPVASVVQTTSTLARSVSATGRLGPEATACATQIYIPQSYRNAIIGSQITGNSSTYMQNHSSSSVTNAPLFLTQSSEIMDSISIGPRFPFGTLNHQDILQNRPPWMETPQVDNSRKLTGDHAQLLNEIPRYDLYSPVRRRAQDHLSELPASTSGRQNHVSVDEFPHIDIINELLDDEHGIGMGYQSFKQGRHSINRQFSLPNYHHGMSSSQVLSSGLCRFERTRSYLDDGFQHGYGSFTGNPYHPIQHIRLHTGPRPYLNGHIDGLTHNQWQISGDMPCSTISNGEIDGYPYHVLDFPNHTIGISGYSVFRPSDGL
ncbi:MATH domain-containing protein [Dorcoceras hygrometricum]|uniref:MATH domain-containing protein n=1 Tax=Dorcoceras hygrometricum TaxID=472368 RepID=A0A2Z7D4I9_9LAMI|nr:MATH domain-containing protein [Dorcoceras hygrometricum]